MAVLDGECNSGYARTSDGAYIAFQTVGSGPVDLVWQFDWFGMDLTRDFPTIRDWIRGLARFSRVVLHDRRGTGASSRDVPAPNLETRVSDLIAVLDTLQVDRPVVLAGQYEGGAPNVLLAATYPDRVRSLVWLSPMARATWTPDYPWGTRSEYLDAERHATTAWGTTEYGRRFRDYTDGMLTHADPEVIGRVSRQWCTPDMARALADLWYETDVRGALPAVSAPALLTANREVDDETEQMDYVRGLLPNAEATRLTGDGPSDEHLEAVRRFLGVHGPVSSLDTILSTVLLTDIVRSTERQAQLGDRGWKDLAESHHGIVREALRDWRGMENDTAGDGFYATFDGPARAVHCALEITERVRALGVEIRAGVHTGECELVDGKPGGIAVSIGARIAAAAQPSQVLVSQTVKDLTAGSGLAFEWAGEHDLKGIPERWRLYAAIRKSP